MERKEGSVRRRADDRSNMQEGLCLRPLVEY